MFRVDKFLVKVKEGKKETKGMISLFVEETQVQNGNGNNLFACLPR